LFLEHKQLMFKPPISKLYAKGSRTSFDLPERAALPSRGKSCRGRCLSVREFIFGKDNENRVQIKPVRSRRSAFCRGREAPRGPKVEMFS